MGVLRFCDPAPNGKDGINLCWRKHFIRLRQLGKDFLEGRLIANPLRQNLLLRLMDAATVGCSWFEVWGHGFSNRYVHYKHIAADIKCFAPHIIKSKNKIRKCGLQLCCLLLHRRSWFDKRRSIRMIGGCGACGRRYVRWETRESYPRQACRYAVHIVHKSIAFF